MKVVAPLAWQSFSCVRGCKCVQVNRYKYKCNLKKCILMNTSKKKLKFTAYFSHVNRVKLKSTNLVHEKNTSV